MKVTNLMVGDWVQHNGNPKMISVIWPFSVSLYDPTKTLGSIYADKFSVEEIQPIELTPEILEKNGFTKENRLYYWTQEKDGKTKAGVYYWVDEKYINIAGYEDDGVTISCHYVHILQHALKLCQIDKEIIL